MTTPLRTLTIDIDLRDRFRPRPDAATLARSRGVPVLDVVVPVYNEQGRPCELGASAAPLSATTLSVRGPNHDRRQRQYRRHPADRRATGRGTDRRACGAAGAEGPRTRSARRVEHLGRAGAGLHGCRLVHRPRGAGPVGGSADFRPFRPRDRLPAGPRLAGGARRQAGGDLALLQPASASRRWRPAFRMRNAGSRRSAPTWLGGCCPTSRTPGGSSTPNCWCSRSAAACASTRSRWTGSTTPTAVSTSSPPPPPISKVSPG